MAEAHIHERRRSSLVAQDFLAANPGQHNVIVGNFRRDSAGQETMLGGEAWVARNEPKVAKAYEAEDRELAEHAGKMDMIIVGVACVILLAWAGLKIAGLDV